MKILHAPEDIAGIGGFLSSYQRSQGHVSDFLIFNESPFYKQYDYCLHLNKLTPKQKKVAMWKNFFRCLLKYDIFHFYFGLTLLPNSIDLRILRFFNKKVVMTCCGTDYRLIQVERERNPYIYLYLQAGIIHDYILHDQRIRRLLRHQSRWIQCFFAPRNGYAHIATVVNPEQINSNLWIHNLACDSDNIIDPESITTRDIPLIVHMPTNRKVKGSNYIQKAIDSLKEKGVQFEYKEITGVVHEEALGIIWESDIVIDQMLLGGIGSTVFESMSLGKPVVSYIIDKVKEEFYPDCPVYNANIDNLEQRLEDLINNKELRLTLGVQGIEFVRNNLDKHKINNELIKVYEGLA